MKESKMGSPDVFEVIGVIVAVVSMIACPIIAHGKGWSAVGWFFGGLLLGSIGLIIVACLYDKSEQW